MVRRFRAGAPRRAVETTQPARAVQEEQNQGFNEQQVEEIRRSAIRTFNRGRAGAFIFFLKDEARGDPGIALKRQFLIQLVEAQRRGEIDPASTIQTFKRRREQAFENLTPEQRERAILIEQGLAENTQSKTREEILQEAFERASPEQREQLFVVEGGQSVEPQREPLTAETAFPEAFLTSRERPEREPGRGLGAAKFRGIRSAASTEIPIPIFGAAGARTLTARGVTEGIGREFGQGAGTAASFLVPETVGGAVALRAGGALLTRPFQKVTQTTTLRQLDDIAAASELQVIKIDSKGVARVFGTGRLVRETQPPKITVTGRRLQFGLARQTLKVTAFKPKTQAAVFSTPKGLKIDVEKGFVTARGAVLVQKTGRTSAELQRVRITALEAPKKLALQLSDTQIVARRIATRTSLKKINVPSVSLVQTKNLKRIFGLPLIGSRLASLQKSATVALTPKRLRLARIRTQKLKAVVFSNVRQSLTGLRSVTPPPVKGIRVDSGALQQAKLQELRFQGVSSQVRLPSVQKSLPRTTTRVISRPAPVTGIVAAQPARVSLKSIPRTKQKTISNVFQVPGQRILQRQSLSSRTSVRTVVRQRDRQRQLPRLDVGQRSRTGQRLDIAQRTTRRSVRLPRLRARRGTPRIFLRVRPPRTRPPRTRPPPRVPRLDFRARRQRGRSIRDQFSVFVRRFGRFRQVGTAQTFAQASQIGRQRVGTTLAATFAVKGPNQKPLKLPGFRTKRERGLRVFIEQPRLRLSTAGEVRSIQRARRR